MQNHFFRKGAGLIFILLLLTAKSALAQGTWYDRGVEEEDNNRKVEYFTKAIELERQDNWVYYFRGWA